MKNGTTSSGRLLQTLPEIKNQQPLAPAKRLSPGGDQKDDSAGRLEKARAALQGPDVVAQRKTLGTPASATG
jgi:hypothetical protein